MRQLEKHVPEPLQSNTHASVARGQYDFVKVSYKSNLSITPITPRYSETEFERVQYAHSFLVCLCSYVFTVWHKMSKHSLIPATGIALITTPSPKEGGKSRGEGTCKCTQATSLSCSWKWNGNNQKWNLHFANMFECLGTYKHLVTAKSQWCINMMCIHDNGLYLAH
jgi:hypothetical protein